MRAIRSASRPASDVRSKPHVRSAARTGAAAPLIARAVGHASNRAIARFITAAGERRLLRDPKAGAAGAPARRVIVLDGNVFDQINRGNKAIATKLLELVRDHEVYIAHSAYQEAVVRRDIPRLAAATELALKELRIKVTPPAPPETLAEVERRNVLRANKTVLSGGDVSVAADAKAIKGEVWSPDRGFRSNAGSVRKTLGVKVAPESQTVAILESAKGAPLPPQDYRVGRKLLGLPEVEIGLSGKVDPPAGSKPPSVKTPAPKSPPVEPIVKAPPVEPVPPSRPTVPTAPKPRISGGARVGISIGLQVGVMVLFWWLGRGKAKEQEKLLEELQAKKVDPAIDKALVAQHDEGDRLNLKDRTKPMYANVSVDFKTTWTESGIGRNRTDEWVSDANFVSLRFSHEPVQSEKKIEHDCSGWGQVKNCYSTTRVTSPLLVFHPDYEDYKRERYEAWKDWVKDNPGWRIEGPTGEAAKGFARLHWMHERRAIQDWLGKLARDEIRRQLGLDRPKKPPAYRVIEIGGGSKTGG